MRIRVTKAQALKIQQLSAASRLAKQIETAYLECILDGASIDFVDFSYVVLGEKEFFYLEVTNAGRTEGPNTVGDSTVRGGEHGSEPGQSGETVGPAPEVPDAVQ